MTRRAFLGLGSNLGDREAHLNRRLDNCSTCVVTERQMPKGNGPNGGALEPSMSMFYGSTVRSSTNTI